jgi:hypothetical protein
MWAKGKEEDTTPATHEELGVVRSAMLPQLYYPKCSNFQATTTLHATNTEMQNPKPCTTGPYQRTLNPVKP